MTDKQLEELKQLLETTGANEWQLDGDYIVDGLGEDVCHITSTNNHGTLLALAPSLARSVICSEKLVEALDRVLTKSATIDDTADLLDALTAYREASK